MPYMVQETGRKSLYAQLEQWAQTDPSPNRGECLVFTPTALTTEPQFRRPTCLGGFFAVKGRHNNKDSGTITFVYPLVQEEGEKNACDPTNGLSVSLGDFYIFSHHIHDNKIQ
ncbi:hypothetical protein AVEN_269588-1 [Araneus ventricosus]|uniref:Uncharacterized protein n=1 Tax=Araneus ventricosus TaxID=182803 RepID=A0A4Y2CF90_ARAVE|nr:hypothetical protein AVEN_269588-1 [Araneus ventricosus]